MIRAVMLKMTLLLVMTLLPTSNARAASGDASLDFASAYVWRGIAFTDGAVFQPSVTIGGDDSAWALNVWGNLDIDDVNNLDGEFQEVDLTFSYTFETDSSLSWELGFIEYLFPNGVGDGTREVYLSLGWDLAISPSITVYYDFDEVDDFYANVGLSVGNDLGDVWSYEFALAAGYAGDDFAAFQTGAADGGMYDGTASLSLNYAPSDDFSLGFYGVYVENLDSDALPDFAAAVDLYGGVSFAFTF